MEEQVFIVTVRASSDFYRYFPKTDAKGLALMIRDNIRCKSRGCIVPTPFEITVQWRGEFASASGEIGRYIPDLFGRFPDKLATNSAC